MASQGRSFALYDYPASFCGACNLHQRAGLSHRSCCLNYLICFLHIHIVVGSLYHLNTETIMVIPTKEGMVPFEHKSIPKPCVTYYKIFGDLGSGIAPLVMLHGGPGVGHDYLLPFSILWETYKIPVIFYDQIGCGKSTHFQDKAGDASFWTEDLFVSELINLIDQLSLRSSPGYSILEQSWGGVLAPLFAATKPRGLKRLILANGISDQPLYIKSVYRRRAEVSAEDQAAIEEAERTGDYSSPAYQLAGQRYMAAATRLPAQMPEPLMGSFGNMMADPTVYGSMMGPSVASPSGIMKEWSTVGRLGRIEVPTLVYNGEFDTSEDDQQVLFFANIPRVRWARLPGAGHFSHLEDEMAENVFALVGEFLLQGKVETV